MTQARIVEIATDPTPDVYIDTRAGLGAEIKYARSPKSGGKYRVEFVDVTIDDGSTWRFLRGCVCATEADHLAADLAKVDVEAAVKSGNPEAMGWRKVG